MSVRLFTWCAIIFAAAPKTALAIPPSLIYDHKLSKLLPPGDDISSNEIKLKIPIVFYGVHYNSVYINANGILSFNSEIPTFFNYEFPLDNAVIAPLYSNVDTSGSGEISYFETADKGYLARADTTVSEAFSHAYDFKTKSVFIVTWSNVGYHRNGTDKLNNFQVAVYSNGVDSFVEFLYPENGIQWVQSEGDGTGLPDVRAQAGFASADGRFYNLPGSGTAQISYLDRTSNMNLPGQWLFRIGDVEEDANIEEPDLFARTDKTKEIPTSCKGASTFCHTLAKCTDYPEGFCCNCKKGYYGNGLQCIKRDTPMRVNGKVTSNINGQQLDTLDLQSYVVTVDARSYTAMSKIPESIGADSQALQVLGATIAWVFAKPVNNALNGFQLTGGVFNHTASVIFPNTNQKIMIRQKYLGLDVFDQLKIEADIQGELPALPVDMQIEIDEYQEQYTLTSVGVLQSGSSHVFKYENLGEEFEVPYQIEQTFLFDYCKFTPLEVGTTWRLKVGRNFIGYEGREQIVRFGMSNKIGPLGEIDPCDEGRASCGRHSSCVVEDDSFRCVCNPGYQSLQINGEEICEDVNECTYGIHDCDYNAQCYNEQGSFRCECNPGFEGDGRVCVNAKSCQNITCNQDAECIDQGNVARCVCQPGFTGNGYSCSPLTAQSCHIANNCSPYGYCAISQETNLYSCFCLPNYEGDGYNCNPLPTSEPEVTTSSAHQISTPSYEDRPTGSTEDAQADSCNFLNNCHQYAQCLFMNNGHYKCFCNPGFEGDGINCDLLGISCSENDICDNKATCSYSGDFGKSICVCNEGYQGDGLSCHAIPNCSSNNDCVENEECRYSALSDSYDCVCKDGLARDSQYLCVQLEGMCGGGKCVENAECIYDDEIQTYYCNCKKDYEGDGITECKPRTIGCNILNNCGLHANCEYNQQNGSFACECSEGYFGDGFICYAEKNCLIDPSLCDRNARCVVDADRKSMCECNPGYDGNGTVCTETPKHDGNFLLVNQGIATLKLSYDPDKKDVGKPIQIKFFQLAVGLDVDCVRGRVYWSDINLKAIRSASYIGTDKRDFIVKDVGSPEGLAIDWVSRNLYWTDSTKDTIEVANVESNLRRTLISTNLVNPRGIAVHPQRGKIFWSDWDRRHPKIEWANADGTGREIFLSGTQFVELPNSLTVDYFSERLCYADAGSRKIICADIDTKQVQVMATNCSYPFGIAVTPEHIYWSDWISKKIERVDKGSLKRLSPLTVPLGGTGNKLYGLVSVPDRCAGLTNVCYYYKDQCPVNYICLPDGKGSRRCLCGSKINATEVNTCNEV